MVEMYRGLLKCLVNVVTTISRTDEVYTLSVKETMEYMLSVHFPGSVPTEEEDVSNESMVSHQEVSPPIDDLLS